MGSLFETLFNFLVDLCEWIAVSFLNLLIDLINAIIIGIASLMGVAIGLLPSPTFDWTPSDGLVSLAGVICWFVPVGTIVNCIGIVAVSTAAYFAIKPILKFAHLT